MASPVLVHYYSSNSWGNYSTVAATVRLGKLVDFRAAARTIGFANVPACSPGNDPAPIPRMSYFLPKKKTATFAGRPGHRAAPAVNPAAAAKSIHCAKTSTRGDAGGKTANLVAAPPVPDGICHLVYVVDSRYRTTQISRLLGEPRRLSCRLSRIVAGLPACPGRICGFTPVLRLLPGPMRGSLKPWFPPRLRRCPRALNLIYYRPAGSIPPADGAAVGLARALAPWGRARPAAAP